MQDMNARASVVLVNPGTHPEPTALFTEFSTRNRTTLHTGSLVDENSLLGGFLRCLQKCLPEAVSRGIDARVISSSAAGTVCTSGLAYEIIYLLARKFRGRDPGQWLERRNRRVIKIAAKHVKRCRPSILVTQQTAASLLLEQKHVDTYSVLMYPIAHHRWSDAEYRLEAEANPDWADLLQGHNESQHKLALMDNEVELADLIVTPSTFARSTFLQMGVDSQKVVHQSLAHNAPAVESLPHRERLDKLRIAFCGQVNQRKGISYLIEAMAQLESEVETHFAGPISNEMQRRLRTILPNAVIHGPLARSDVYAFLRSCDLLILPSLNEGFGLTALEAMSVGTPCIVSTNTFAGDLIEDGRNGWIVPVRDSVALQRRLEQLVSQPLLLSRAGDLAMQTAASMTWANYAHGLADLIEERAARNELH